MRAASSSLAALVLAVALVAMARAADLSSSSPAPAATRVAVAERLATARQAIAARDWTVAMRELQAAEREDPRNADVHNLLGYSWRKRATPDLAKAFQHYRTALQLDPRHQGAHEYIGEAYLMDRQPAEAEKHLAQLEQICGNRSCEAYRDLARAIAEYQARR